MLEVNPKVHVFSRMNNNIDEVHARSLKLCTGIRVHEHLHQLLKSVLFTVLSLKVVNSFNDLNMPTFHQTHRSQQINDRDGGSERRDRFNTAAMGRLNPLRHVQFKKTRVRLCV